MQKGLKVSEMLFLNLNHDGEVTGGRLGVGWGRRWEGSSRGRGHSHTYGSAMLMYGRNQHNIGHQLTFS